jgi:hypothetical protein
MGRIRTSRDWLATAGPKPRQSVEISFLLSEPGTVVFRVEEISPHCRYVGRFLVRGRSGRNVVRFRGRLRGRALPPGTYRVTAWVRGQTARQIKTTVVVFARPAGRAEIASARLRNACEGALESTGIHGPMGGVAGARASLAPTKRRPAHGPLGAAFSTLRSAADAVPAVFFAFAALAMLLLGVASMPQPLGTSRAGALLVHHRGTIALAGVGVLITGLLAFIALF